MCELEVVATLFEIGLVATEAVYRRLDRLTCWLLGTDRVYLVADCLQGLIMIALTIYRCAPPPSAARTDKGREQSL
jgi:hypothetical protein